MSIPDHAFSSFNEDSSLVAADSLVRAERGSQSKANVLTDNLQRDKSPSSMGVINHVDNKPACLTHLSVKVPCQLCKGRGHYVDIVDKGERRIVVRRRCEACKGTGSIDISRGPVTDDLAPHEAFIASLRLSNKQPTTHCENCGGDGGWLEPCGRFDVCPCCEGTGELPTAERDLISLDDLDTINRDKPAVIAECDLGLDCPFRRICLSEGRTC